MSTNNICLEATVTLTQAMEFAEWYVQRRNRPVEIRRYDNGNLVVSLACRGLDDEPVHLSQIAHRVGGMDDA